jgi:DtxR family Mn-dependent transcriptional regulator
MPNQLSDKAEEILEHLWIETIEKREAVRSSILPDEVLRDLHHRGLLDIDAGEVRLTQDGTEQAKGCVRRHRLAERLLSDILDGADEQIHAAGCKFEHGLHRGLEEKVCTILGHPEKCPHDKPIPRGRCCHRMEKEPGQLISSLTESRVGQHLVVAYLQSEEHADLRKLMAVGALPGTEFTLKQRFPSYVLKIGHTEFAIDAEMASEIYVRPATPK